MKREALYEDGSFQERELAALVASKVYYHLQEYNESMVFALGAGKLLNLDHGGEFEETIICRFFPPISISMLGYCVLTITPVAKCIDTFISLSASPKTQNATQTPNKAPRLNTSFPPSTNGATSTAAGLTSPITPFSQSTLPSKSLLSRQDSISLETGGEDIGADASELPLVIQRGVQKQLQAVIERLFEQCFREKRYRQVVGIAVEAKNLDVLRTAILRASEDEKKEDEESSRSGEELMEYVLDICMSVVQERAFRNEVSWHAIQRGQGVRSYFN